MALTGDSPSGGGSAAHRSTRSAARCSGFPTDQPEADGTLEWSATTVVVVEVDAGGTVGSGLDLRLGAHAKPWSTTRLADAVVGADALDIPRAHEAMVRACRNLGRPGIVASAISAVDIALWDLKARLLGVALSRPLRSLSRRRPHLWERWLHHLRRHAPLSSQLERWVGDVGDTTREDQDRRVLGHGRRTAISPVWPDAAASSGTATSSSTSTPTAATRPSRPCGSDVDSTSDYGVIWFEEPVSSDDLAGLRRVRATSAST